MTRSLSVAASRLQRSLMRDLLALTARPGVISLAGGLPADELLPRDELQTCFDAVLTRDGGRALQYGPPFAPLKEQIALYMRRRGVFCRPDEIFITNGSQQGLELLARLFMDSGQHGVVEEFTFTGILQALRAHGGELHALPTYPAHGVDVEAVMDAFSATPAPRLGIVIPDFHNPLGACIPAEQRPRLADIAARHAVPLIEDDPYSPLRFDGVPLPPIKSYDEDGAVIYLGSFSKMLAPALRLGWIVAPPDLMPHLTVIRESLDLESSQLIQRAVAEFLARGLLERHLARLNAANRLRRDAMVAALERELGGLARWITPQGGLFIWLSLAAGCDTYAIFKDALQQDLAFVPGQAFSARPPAVSESLRLNFSNASVDMITEGVRRLAGVVRAHAAAAAS